MNRLGFSDLTEDEALLIALYRDWSRPEINRAAMEAEMMGALSHDPISDALDAAFATFWRHAAATTTSLATGDHLSGEEERLLTALSDRFAGGGPHVRPAGAIARSGTDDIVARLTAAAHRVALGV